jgi:uncharacterized protein
VTEALLTTLLVGTAMVVGLAGTILPILPGAVIIWLSALVYGIVLGFGPVGWVSMALITVVLGAGAWWSIRIPQRRTAAAGVSVRTQLFALATAVAGHFVLPVAGAAAGFLGGIFLAHLTMTRDPATAWRSTRAALDGLWRAAAAQFGAGLAAVTIWVIWVIAG